MAPWRLADEPLADRTSPIGPHHLGVGAGFINEDKPFRVKVQLGRLPALARLGDVGPVLLSGVQRFF